MEAFMTTFYRETAICPICGSIVSYSAIGSTNAFGSMDLDTRPPEMERSTISHWLIECPECGYVAPNMREKPAIDRDFLESDIYKTCDGMVFESNLAEGFYKRCLISLRSGELEHGMFDMLHAAWACDDAGDPNAAKLRSYLVEIADALISEDDREELRIMRADFLRRSGEFDKVIEDYGNAKFSNDLLNTIARFQVKLAGDKDSRCYTVQDAIENEK